MEQPLIIVDADRGDKGYWKDVWRYRGLFSFLAWRDLLVRYKQTFIGVAWALVRPLLTIVVFSFFRYLMDTTISLEECILAVSVATIPWQLFAAALGESSGSLVSNSSLLTKVYFPRVIVPLSTIIVCIVDFLLSLLILAGVMLYFGHAPSWNILVLPLFVLLALLAATGTGLFLAALNVRYRDFRYVVPIIIQLGTFISPIAISSADVYASEKVPEVLKGLYSLNPMVAVIDGFRWCLLDAPFVVNQTGLFLSLGMTVIMLIIGVWYFRRVESTFADVI
jgi:lipopolysaccharide transport system permease protein